MHSFALDLIKKNKDYFNKKLHKHITVLEYVPIRLLNIPDQDLPGVSNKKQGDESLKVVELNNGDEQEAEYIMIDVSRLQRADGKLIVQCGGFSNEMLVTKSFDFGTPKTIKIGLEQQAGYLSSNKIRTLREAQISMEINRMRAAVDIENERKKDSPHIEVSGLSEFHVNDAMVNSENGEWVPPLGYSIHHFPLTPNTEDQTQDQHQPYVGVAYVMLPTDTIPMQAISDTAGAVYIATKYILRNRIQDLFGGFSGEMSTSFIAGFLFGHHWLYPNKPSGLKLLYAVSGFDINALNEMYHRHGWPIPPTAEFRDKNINLNVDCLLNDIVNDLDWLIKYSGLDGLSENNNIKSTIFIVAIYIAGEIKSLVKNRTRYLYLYPKTNAFDKNLLKNEKLSLWVFKEQAFNSQIANEVYTLCDSDIARAAPYSYKQKMCFGSEDESNRIRVVGKIDDVNIRNEAVPSFFTTPKLTSSMNCSWLANIAIHRLLKAQVDKKFNKNNKSDVSIES